MTQIRIERLRIRARGITAEVARSAADGLAAQILRELDARCELPGRSGRVSVDRVAPEPLAARRGAAATELRDALGRAAVDGIVAAAGPLPTRQRQE